MSVGKSSYGREAQMNKYQEALKLVKKLISCSVIRK